MDDTLALSVDPLTTAKRTPQFANVDHIAQVDMAKLRAYRLSRVQDQLRKRDYGAALLSDPINVRYATGLRNMQVWAMHNAARYAFVPAEGKAVIFDHRNTEHLARGLETISESRRAKRWYYFAVADRLNERVTEWAAEIQDLMCELCPSSRRLAVDHLDIEGVSALQAHGIQLFNGQEPLEHARCVKSPEEVACLSRSVSVCETAMSRLQEALKPGVSEIQLWAILNQTNAELGGEYLETRLLSSGGRTNPWYQEASDRLVRPRDLVALDCDMVGPFGYDADISRTFFCGPGRPSGDQRTLYCLSHEQIEHNIELIRPGVSLREISERCWQAPPQYRDQVAGSVFHGIGMCNEYPMVPSGRFDEAGYEGVLEEGMTLCVESYIGKRGGLEGVKLEQMVLVTANGVELMSTYPFEDDLLK